ncbi:MAG: hypothetical protein ABWZ25_16700 [Chitinophagaceae bacterium]
MDRKYIGLFLFCLPLIVQAQFTLSVQLPPAGLIQREQLWNLVLVNNSNSIEDASVFLDLKDAATGVSMLSASSGNVLLGKGIKMITIKDVQPIQYNYGAGNVSGNFLPLGSYIACYTIVSNSKGSNPLAEECVRLNINPLSPPMLNTPANKEVLQFGTPQFTWIPPAPLDMFVNLSYDISVVEVKEGQSPAESILYNSPIYVRSNIRAAFENYPSTYSSLEAGKTYAWQITARNGLSYAAATDVWTFSKAVDSSKIEATNLSYVLLKDNKDEAGINYISLGHLNVKYYSFDKEHETTIRFLNAEGTVLHEKRKKIKYGDNFLQFELKDRFRTGQIYLIEIIDQHNRIHSASFSIK